MVASSNVSARHGFALLLVLTILAASANVGVEVILAGSSAAQATRNRLALTRAQWKAEGCVELFRAAVGSALRADSFGHNAWSRLDTIAPTVGLSGECRLIVQPSGITIDIDSLTEDQLRHILTTEERSTVQIDSMIDAFGDWIDADTSVRRRGAERSWYTAAHRPGPRNGALTSIQELRLVRGFETDDSTASLLGVESGRLIIDRAPLPLVGLLPGMTNEAITLIAGFRAAGQPVGDLAALASRLTPASRESLLSHYAQIVARTSPVPQWWTVRSENTQGEPAITAKIEVRLVRSGNEAAIVRYRAWP
jgi:type II secretory pathway component PulK